MISFPENPNSDALTDALHKGLGRAYFWARAGKFRSGDLLQACLSDYRFDRQVEDPRGDWLWQLNVAAGLVEQLKQPVLAAMKTIEESGARSQLCQLARHYAAAGDQRFRIQLQRIVLEQPVDDDPVLGQEQLVRLDGAKGFLAVVSRNGADLKSRTWDWFDAALVDDAIRWIGEEMVVDVLNMHTNQKESVRRFAELYHRYRKRRPNKEQASNRGQIAKYSAAEIIEAAESPDKSFVFRGWGRHAKPGELDRVYQRLLATTDIESLRRYLQVFAARPWPRFDKRMLQLCLHDDHNIRRRAATAVSNNRHPEIRRFALEHLQNPKQQEYAIEMLAANYELGDEDRVLGTLAFPEDRCDLHGTLMGLRTLVENNTTSNCREAAELVYEKTPCSACRYAMVKLLAERIGLPETICAESQFDVEADIRLLADGPPWND